MKLRIVIRITLCSLLVAFLYIYKSYTPRNCNIVGDSDFGVSANATDVEHTLSESSGHTDVYDIHQHFNQSDWGYCHGYVRNERCPEGTSQLQAATAVNIGIMKSGTTALDWVLDLHEDITVLGRESFFFGVSGLTTEGKLTFCNNLPCRREPAGIILDRCPFYFIYEKSCLDIYKNNKKMKLLLIVREPVERMMSHLIHQSGSGTPWKELASKVINPNKDNPTVSNRSMFIRYSNYYQFLPCWLEKFEINKTLLIIDHYKFRHNLYNVLHRIEDFLGLEHKISPNDVIFDETKKFYCKAVPHKDGLRECMGRDKGRTHTQIPPDDYFLLKKYFRKSNELFFKAIGEDLGWNDYFNSNITLGDRITNL